MITFNNTMQNLPNTEESSTDGEISFMYLYFTIKYTICILICILSYTALLCKFHQSKKNLQGPENKVTSSDDTEIRMSRTILMLITMNIICLLPYLIYYAVGFEKYGTSRSFRASIQFEVVEAIYVSQFALNFLVYVARSSQSRKASLFYWLYLKSQFKLIIQNIKG